MNLQTTHALPPLRVLVVNPLLPAAQLTIVNILSGKVFGCSQLIDLILVVYYNELPLAESFTHELTECAFSCYNSITLSSDLPSLSDADVFCFMTSFVNPNKINFQKVDDEQLFDSLYLIIKISNNLSGQPSPEVPIQIGKSKNKQKEQKKPIKPVIITDGLVAIDILMSMSKSLPPDIFFCPTYLHAASKSILGEYLKVQCDIINHVYVWAADDTVFHVEIDRPLLLNDDEEDPQHCDEEVMGKKKLSSYNFDHTQLSASWMKKEFIDKVRSFSSKNPYGCICKGEGMSRALRRIWKSRFEDGNKVYGNLGVISDGSLETVKGLPYVLPLILTGDTWSVNERYKHEPHLKQEIKRMNQTAKKHHDQLISYCKKFLNQNLLHSVSSDDRTDTDTLFSTAYDSSRPSFVYSST